MALGSSIAQRVLMVQSLTAVGIMPPLNGVVNANRNITGLRILGSRRDSG